MRRIKLYCLPYGGGSAASYLKWKGSLSKGIELCPVELAGRGKRFSEPFYESINEAVEDVYQQIHLEIDDSPYAFFGHSMGSIILYELYFRLIERNHKPPVHLFISGRRAPECQDSEITYNLPEAEFVKKVLQYGGTPKEFFENKDLADIFIPLLRADFKIVQTYAYTPKCKNLSTDVTIMYGKDDSYTSGDVDSWEKHVTGTYTMHEFEGGHFFIFKSMQQVLDVLNQTLLKAVC